MRVSKAFLNDYVDMSDISYEEFAEKMVFAGNEYESIQKLSDATNVVVGLVESCENHPDSKKLHICQVNTGGEIRQILCGAPNIEANRKVIVALPGAKLPGGIEIKKAKLAGMDSEGMICSLGELGIESKYQSEEDKKGIHFLDDTAVVGEDAIHYLGYDDQVINFELTADRGDLLSYLGMAYEAGALYEKEVTYPNCEIHPIHKSDFFHLEVKTDYCPLYLGTKVYDITIQESPKWMQERLIASGIRPINNVVDISNYVMLEYGQPLHFFDADKLDNCIVVRMAHEKETLTTLDGQERLLTEDDIVITDGQKPIALAGVMGGLETEITNATKNIFIESAVFEPYHIRATAKKILRSEASSRYEKGIDVNCSKQALLRACHLLEELAFGKPETDLYEYDVTDKKEIVIPITLSKINQVLGMQLTREQVESVWKRLHFSYHVEGEQFQVSAPTRRLDIKIPEDLIEEVGRMIGYRDLKGTLPQAQVKKGSYSKKAKWIKEIRNQLQALGFNQVLTYSLISEAESMDFIDQPFTKVVLQEPMSEDKKVMRNTLLTSLMKVWQYNLERGNKEIFIYEIGSAYRKEEEYIEETKVAGLVYGEWLEKTWNQPAIKVDFYVLKGIVETLLQYLGFQNRYQFTIDFLLKDLHPSKSCGILLDHELIGYMGQVHPSKEKKEVYVFEFSLDKLMEKKVRGIKNKEISKYPSVHKDLAFLVKKELPASSIIELLRKVGGRLLKDVTVFDVYEGSNIQSDEKSLAFSLTFQENTRTLTDAEVMTIFNHMITEVEDKLGAKLRDHV